MNAIYKYELNGDTLQTILLPADSIVLSVVEQYEKIIVYAIVDVQQSDIEEIQFLLLDTGQAFNNTLDGYTFLNTVKLSDGDVMVHVFVEKRRG